MSGLHESCTPEERALLEREGLDTVEGAFAYDGGEQLAKPGLGRRRRFRLRLTGESGESVEWYLKRYGPEPWSARLRRWLPGPGRVGAAGREVANIRRVEQAGVSTMRVMAWGAERGPLAPRRGYVIVTGVPGEALSRCFDGFLARFGGDEDAMRRFNAALVELACKLHAAGLVHRDLYAAHVFLDETPRRVKLYLIDLARVFAPRWRRFRWRVKDLAQLKYSMPAAWVERHWGAFLEAYLAGAGAPGRAGRWAAAIDRKVASMRRRRPRDAPGRMADRK